MTNSSAQRKVHIDLDTLDSNTSLTPEEWKNLAIGLSKEFIKADTAKDRMQQEARMYLQLLLIETVALVTVIVSNALSW